MKGFTILQCYSEVLTAYVEHILPLSMAEWTVNTVANQITAFIIEHKQIYTKLEQTQLLKVIHSIKVFNYISSPVQILVPCIPHLSFTNIDHK